MPGLARSLMCFRGFMRPVPGFFNLNLHNDVSKVNVVCNGIGSVCTIKLVN